MNNQELKTRYVTAGCANKDAKWYWDKDEGAWCLPLKDIVLSEGEIINEYQRNDDPTY